jgi:hypothetical protein
MCFQNSKTHKPNKVMCFLLGCITCLQERVCFGPVGSHPSWRALLTIGHGRQAGRLVGRLAAGRPAGWSGRPAGPSGRASHLLPNAFTVWLQMEAFSEQNGFGKHTCFSVWLCLVNKHLFPFWTTRIIVAVPLGCNVILWVLVRQHLKTRRQDPKLCTYD